jgi:hypothetical protein
MKLTNSEAMEGAIAFAVLKLARKRNLIHVSDEVLNDLVTEWLQVKRRQDRAFVQSLIDQPSSQTLSARRHEAMPITVNVTPTIETRSSTNTMAKQIKNKYLVTIPVTELVPEGEKPLKLKDIKTMMADAFQLDPDLTQLTAGKTKVEAV